ncbi:MAG: 4,5-dihydroxyphthalate decarboxylase [Alphaproteobacteria bacterium]
MNELDLTLAVCDYDHVRDLVNGAVPVEGLRINFQNLTVQEIFHRFTTHREWDASEMSMGMYVSLRSQGDDSLSAIPVFTSRVFRHSSFYVLRDGPVRMPADLRGRRVGYPEWAHTAGMYSRAYLMHDIGIPLEEIEWVQSGVNQGGRAEHVKLSLPDTVKLVPELDKSLDEMLLSGEIDALMSSLAPRSFLAGNTSVVRLIPNFQQVERDSYRDTGVFPIMHLIAIKREILDRHPWVAKNLLSGFETAKDRSVARLRDGTISRFPFPWAFACAEEMTALMGDDIWPYGVEANRITLQAFLQMCQEQGISHRSMTVEELFADTVLGGFKV